MGRDKSGFNSVTILKLNLQLKHQRFCKYKISEVRYHTTRWNLRVTETGQPAIYLQGGSLAGESIEDGIRKGFSSALSCCPAQS